ncbi:serine/threonine-protein kinase S6KL [Orussus abietinus]|uniref:serine/threonine-protein kinase S6KL n=1 Tax=Orussus abietinus TaxID=222816 RepID=UPI000625B618|nr:serine/threonine-protein kinase S6KL [Orussus abietinus]
MGNSSNKKKRHEVENYASQYSLSDILNKACTGASRLSSEDLSRYSQVSPKSWSEGTLSNPYGRSKTQWPVARFEAIFLPEFKVLKNPLKSEFAFVDLIETGAYRQVYKVRERGIGGVYALKVLNKAKILADDAVVQAKQEVAILKAVGHYPFILTPVRHWQGRKTLYILTEYIGGGELYSLIEDYGCLPEDVVRIYIAEIALALDFLHNAGIIHRDLKATNVLLNDEGHAVLIDFGLAKWLRPTHKTSTFCGTAEYMAPEVLRGEYYGHEVDWWSLGVLACLLLTNQYPARGRSDLLPDTGDQEDQVPGTLPDVEMSPGAMDLLKRLLQPEPRLRLHSILALQRVKFYMGHNIRAYCSLSVSPFRILGRKPGARRTSTKHDFPDFDSPVGMGTSRG